MNLINSDEENLPRTKLFVLKLYMDQQIKIVELLFVVFKIESSALY